MSDPRVLRLGLAQADAVLGDVEANLDRACGLIEAAVAHDCQLVVFPELALSGLTVADVALDCALAPDSPVLWELRERSRDISIAIGYVERGRRGELHNTVGFFEDGELVHAHRKLYLTTYGDLVEGKAFKAGDQARAFDSRHGRFAIAICEDAWHLPVPYMAAMAGAEVLLICAASPRGNTSHEVTSETLWRTVNRSHAVTLKLFDVFVNRVGVEDPHVFWGGSHVIAPDGRFAYDTDDAAEGLHCAQIDLDELARQRFRFPYLRDERLEMTLRELGRLADERWAEGPAPAALPEEQMTD